jgi:PAS domain S-box-containing protein
MTPGGELERSQERLARLRIQVDRVGVDPALAEAVEELGNTLEELGVSLEELEVQSEELAKARESAEETARHYADLFRSAPDLYLVTDEMGVITEANAAAETKLGRRLDYLCGKPLIVFVAASDHVEFDRLLSSVGEPRAQQRAPELRFEPKTTAGFWGAISTAEIRDASGGVEGVRWLIRDISERWLAEEALREALARNQAILEGAGEAIVVIDSSGTIEAFNSAAVHLFGYSAEEAIGRNVSLLMPSPYREQHDGYIARYLQTRESRLMYRPREFPALRKDGSTFQMELSVTRIDHLDRFTGVIRDLTAQQRLQRQLRAATAATAVAEERERRSLARDLHDDLGQLLSLAGIRLAQLHGAGGAGFLERLKEVEKLIGDAQERTGSLTFRLSPPLLHDVGLAAAAEWLAEEMERSYGLRVTLDDDGQPKPLDEATRTILFRALRELLINVARHSGTKAAHVRLWRTDAEIGLSVDDDGVGFDPSVEPTGFGLLSLGERLRHVGGKMTIESIPGDGARIVLLAPIASDERELEAPGA